MIFKPILQGLFWGRIFSPEPHRNNNINYLKKEISHSRMLFTGWITVVCFVLSCFASPLSLQISAGLKAQLWSLTTVLVWCFTPKHHGLVGLFYRLAISGSLKGMLLKILSVWPVSDWWLFSCLWLYWIPAQLIPENSPSREVSSHSCVPGPPQCTQPSSLCFGAERTKDRTFSLLHTHWLYHLFCAVFHMAFIYVTLYTIYLAF